MPSPYTLAPLWTDLTRALRDRRWCLIGAQAAILYGSTRATADVDISLGIDDNERDTALASLVACGFEPLRACPRGPETDRALFRCGAGVARG